MFKKLLFGLGLVALLAVGGAAASTVMADSHTQTFRISVDNVANFRFASSSVFNTPVGQGGPGPLLPGNSYQTTVYGNPGDNVSFATMFVQSNDWFFAPDELGIPLYNADGSAKRGDVTAYVKLWDAGTEGDEPVGEGVNQAPRQAAADTGPADPDNTVRRVFRPAADYVRVTLTPQGSGQFTLNIQNIASSGTPLAPGVAVVHNTPAPLFVNGHADFGVGLEALAEDGGAAGLGAYLAARTGVNTPIAPVAWAVHSSPNALFASGTRASAGLEALAEDGGPAGLVASVAVDNKGAAAVPVGASGAGPAFAPHGTYTFDITAAPGEHISLATMFVQSNDWFFALNNIPLFDADGDALSGDITHLVRVYDAGTEVNQIIGFGSNQAPRQAGPNTGAAEGGVVHGVNVNAANYIVVNITPIN